MKIHSFYPPQKIRILNKKFTKDVKFRILDIGCGNGSPSLFKKYWPNSTYHGIDIEFYNLSDDDIKLIDKMFFVTPDMHYSALKLEKYDAIILNHTIEHMKDPYINLSYLCSLLNDNGLIYIAFPSEKSLSLPSALGTLQFCDDSTHVFIPSVREVANILLSNNCIVPYAGKGVDKIRFVIGFFIYPFQLLKRILGLPIKAKGLWYFLGFESVCIGVKKSSNGNK